MTSQIVLRDVARIILPLSIFMGLFAQGAASAAGFALAVLCVADEMRRKLAPAENVGGQVVAYAPRNDGIAPQPRNPVAST
jgi:hypothetical protein